MMDGAAEAERRYHDDPAFRQFVDIIVRLADVNAYTAHEVQLAMLQALRRIEERKQ